MGERSAYLVDGVRTAIGSFAGSLSGERADDLAAFVIRKLLEKFSGLDAGLIDDVILGCANQAGEDNRNVARMAALLAGLPQSVPGITVNRLCASGLSAAISAAQGIVSGHGELYVAGGVESMTRAPFVLSKAHSAFSRTAEIFDTSIGWRFVNPKMREAHGIDSMGETAENVAEKYGISREDQDKFALSSQLKAAAARERGRFAAEIAALEVPQGAKKPPITFAADEFIRPESSIEGLSKLKPAFRQGGTVTAGNSSGINDGACALLICSEEVLKKFGWVPKAKIVAAASAGVEPRLMGVGPVPATNKALSKAKLALKDIAVIELNEAFAAQSLACLRELGLKDDDARVNPNGGAIALGHPLGMSGARLLLTAAHELAQRSERFGLCTMCVGVGQGVAAIIERV
ncbi:MAG: 3-oxoadipyl-CoA thiolase [Proteobacteria bacterium]|nr:MAG: 3-oxoadipyl-CoA thiolase [Pseudomonadota bacterium]